MEIKVELINAIYPQAGGPRLLQQRGVSGSLLRAPTGPTSVLESGGSPVLPSMCSGRSSQGRNRQILCLSTSIVHRGEAGVSHVFKERGKGGHRPLLVPSSLRTAVLEGGQPDLDIRTLGSREASAQGPPNVTCAVSLGTKHTLILIFIDFPQLCSVLFCLQLLEHHRLVMTQSP